MGDLQGNLEVVLIAAVAQNGVIGRNGALPWAQRIEGDLNRFRQLTTSYPVIMGRKTWESLPTSYRPLPKRLNIVLTRNPQYEVMGGYVFGSVQDAFNSLAGQLPVETDIHYDRVFVIGGGDVYQQALPHARRLELTEVHGDVEGDTFFPTWDRQQWDEITRIPHATHDFVTYVRKG